MNPPTIHKLRPSQESAIAILVSHFDEENEKRGTEESYECTTRQKNLYKFLERGRSDGTPFTKDRPATQTEIIASVEGYEENANNVRNNDKCRQIYTDKDAINATDKFSFKIISNGHYEYWLASSDGEIEEIQSLFIGKAELALDRYVALQDHKSAVGQGKIVTNEYSPRTLDKAPKAEEYRQIGLMEETIEPKTK